MVTKSSLSKAYAKSRKENKTWNNDARAAKKVFLTPDQRSEKGNKKEARKEEKIEERKKEEERERRHLTFP